MSNRDDYLKIGVGLNFAAVGLQAAGVLTPSWVVYETGDVTVGLLSSLGCENEDCYDGLTQMDAIIMLALTLMLGVNLGINAWAVSQNKRPQRADVSSAVLGMSVGVYTFFNVIGFPDHSTVGYSPILCFAAAVLSVGACAVYFRDRHRAKMQVNPGQGNAGPWYTQPHTAGPN